MSTFSYRLKISYDGFGYEGWQVQPDGHKTIQGELNKSLKKIAKCEDVTSLGSGRTDSGVHANAQIVRVNLPLDIDNLALLRALNSHLPKSIRVIECEVADDDFHPVRDALWKRYVYMIDTESILSPHLRNYVTPISRDVDWEKVKTALELFVGEHNFINFSTKGTEVNSTVRTLFMTRLENVEVQPNPGNTDKVTLKRLVFEGSGFLKQMVRLLVGTAIAAGQNKVDETQIKSYLQQEFSVKLAAVAPAQGLYLDHVEYDSPHPSTH